MVTNGSLAAPILTNSVSLYLHSLPATEGWTDEDIHNDKLLQCCKFNSSQSIKDTLKPTVPKYIQEYLCGVKNAIKQGAPNTLSSQNLIATMLQVPATILQITITLFTTVPALMQEKTFNLN